MYNRLKTWHDSSYWTNNTSEQELLCCDKTAYCPAQQASRREGTHDLRALTSRGLYIAILQAMRDRQEYLIDTIPRHRVIHVSMH